MAKRIRDLLAALRRPRGSLRRRILAGNAVIALFLLLAAALVAWQVRELVLAVNTLEEARVQVDAAVVVRQRATDLLASVTRLLPDEDAVAFSSEVAARLDRLRESRQQMLLTIEGVDDAATIEAVEAVNQQVTNVINIADTMVRQAESDQWHSVVIRVGLLTRDQEQVISAVDVLVSRAQVLEEVARERVTGAVRAVIIYPTLVLAVTLVFGVGLVMGVTDSITRPVERLTAGATELAAGAFDRRVPVERRDEIGQLSQAFNQMAEQLQGHYEQLEARVSERTRALETTLRVGRRLSTILNPETLTQEVVDQIQQAFSYYHVHIYLFDLNRETLLMVGGTGEAGRAMLMSGHRLKAGQGLVGRSAGENRVVLVPDVRAAKDWLPNPLLPETRCEVAVPITFGNQVRGVLDVQHNVVGGLGADDAEYLQIIAAQVAVALQNAQLMAQVQTRADHVAKLNAASQRIQAAATLEELLQAAVQELGRALPAERATIELRRPQLETGMPTAAQPPAVGGKSSALE